MAGSEVGLPIIGGRDALKPNALAKKASACPRCGDTRGSAEVVGRASIPLISQESPSTALCVIYHSCPLP